MNMTADRIVAMLRASITAAYGDETALEFGVSPETGAVVICPPVTRRDLSVWAISIRPGPVPLEIELLGLPPLEDPRFQQAIGDTLGGWIHQPELLHSREMSVLEELRDHLHEEAWSAM